MLCLRLLLLGGVSYFNCYLKKLGDEGNIPPSRLHIRCRAMARVRRCGRESMSRRCWRWRLRVEGRVGVAVVVAVRGWQNWRWCCWDGDRRSEWGVVLVRLVWRRRWAGLDMFFSGTRYGRGKVRLWGIEGGKMAGFNFYFALGTF